MKFRVFHVILNFEIKFSKARDVQGLFSDPSRTIFQAC